MTKRDPFRPVDGEARALARRLIAEATYAALAVLQNGMPSVTRIAFATTPDGVPLSLISELSSHTKALDADPRAALLVGEPEDKGDPLTHPRITLHAKADFIDRDDPIYTDLRAHYLKLRPKAQLYIDFADFRLVRFDIDSAFLNGGFGKAYKLARDDLAFSA